MLPGKYLVRWLLVWDGWEQGSFWMMVFPKPQGRGMLWPYPEMQGRVWGYHPGHGSGRQRVCSAPARATYS